MRRFTRYLLWLFVFTVPWDVVSLPFVGSISRAVGLAALGAAALTSAAEARFRRPDLVFGLAIVFTTWVALSLLWTISYEDTLTRVLTFGQLVGIVWIVREFARTREQQQSLLVAFCLGAFVPMASLLINFRANVQITMAGRFSASGVNANDLGLTLVLGIPMAWYLIQHRGGLVRVLAFAYFTLAPLSILLTGTRGAFLAGMVALSIVPLTLPRLTGRSYVIAALLLAVVATTTAAVVPQATWSRVFSIQSQVLEGGSLTGRKDIWMAGLQVFPEHPFLGVGAGAYGQAVGSLLNNAATVSHNVPLGLLVELGIVGLSIFLALLAACARTILALPTPDRKLWAVVLLSWLVGVMSVNWEHRKPTWLLFGLVAANSAVAAAYRQKAESRARWSPAGPQPAFDRDRTPYRDPPPEERIPMNWDRRPTAQR